MIIDEILNFIKENSRHQLIFVKNADAIETLKLACEELEDRSGIYLVFSDKVICKDNEHLHFSLNGQISELIYFGKAGGITSTGKSIRQGLRGRINNVVSVGNRKFVKRAIYWRDFMDLHDIVHFTIVYGYLTNPQKFEDSIYHKLDTNDVNYPKLNKRRGRRLKD